MTRQVLSTQWGPATVGPEEAQRRLRMAFNLLMEPLHPPSRTQGQPTSGDAAVPPDHTTDGRI